MFIIVFIYSVMIPIKHLLESKRKKKTQFSTSLTFDCLSLHTDHAKDKSSNLNIHIKDVIRF